MLGVGIGAGGLLLAGLEVQRLALRVLVALIATVGRLALVGVGVRGAHLSTAAVLGQVRADAAASGIAVSGMIVRRGLLVEARSSLGVGVALGLLLLVLVALLPARLLLLEILEATAAAEVFWALGLIFRSSKLGS